MPSKKKEEEERQPPHKKALTCVSYFPPKKKERKTPRLVGRLGTHKKSGHIFLSFVSPKMERG